MSNILDNVFHQADETSAAAAMQTHGQKQFRLFKVSLSDRDRPNFAAMPGRNRYGFDQIKPNEYMRFPYAPGSADAKKLIAAAGAWGRKNFGHAVFSVEPEGDAICLWRTA